MFRCQHLGYSDVIESVVAEVSRAGDTGGVGETSGVESLC